MRSSGCRLLSWPRHSTRTIKHVRAWASVACLMSTRVRWANQIVSCSTNSRLTGHDVTVLCSNSTRARCAALGSALRHLQVNLPHAHQQAGYAPRESACVWVTVTCPKSTRARWATQTVNCFTNSRLTGHHVRVTCSKSTRAWWAALGSALRHAPVRNTSSREPPFSCSARYTSAH